MTHVFPYLCVLSLDDDDPYLASYFDLFERESCVKIVNQINKGCCEAINRAAQYMNIYKGDLIVVISDDLIPFAGWDNKLLEFIDQNITKDEFLIHISDGHGFRDDCALIPIMSGALYQKLGYVFYPEYISQFADNDLWNVCHRLGAVYPFRDFAFFHNHPDFGGSLPLDDTYRHSNSSDKIALGRKIWERRCTENFGFPNA